MVKGLFITIEGIEGAGKTTVIQSITSVLDEAKISHRLTREPGGTAMAEEIRALLLSTREEKVDPVAELLMMYAARVQHVSQIIKPALKSGQHVICDRFNDSTFAYQGGGRGLSIELIKGIDHLTLGDFVPDLTLLLDLDVAIGLERASNRSEKDRIEQEKYEFFEKVRAAYLARARQHPHRYQIIDASQTVDEVKHCTARIIREFVLNRDES